MSGKSYPIWNEVEACIYQSGKSFGAKNESNIKIKVGSSSDNSHELVRIRTTKRETEEYISFAFFVNDVEFKRMVFTNNKGRAGELVETILKSNL